MINHLHPTQTTLGSATTPQVGVASEVGTLRRVMLHRPGNELKRLTPTNKDDLLFDDVLWVKRARQEHDAFADTLVERGVEVLYLNELLIETLSAGAARIELIDGMLRSAAARGAVHCGAERVAGRALARDADRGRDRGCDV